MPDPEQQLGTDDMYDEENNWLYQEVVNLDEDDDEDDEESEDENADEAIEAVRVNEEHETDSDATEIDEDGHSAVSGKFVGNHFIF